MGVGLIQAYVLSSFKRFLMRVVLIQEGIRECCAIRLREIL